MNITTKIISKGRVIGYIIDGRQISREAILKHRKELKKYGIICDSTGLIRCNSGVVKIDIKDLNRKMDFNREITMEFDRWYSLEHDTALYVRGPRQVGKTYEVLKYSKSHFNNVVYIDITDKSKSAIRSLLEKAGSDNIMAIISTYCNSIGVHYTNDNNTVIIIDEIQDSEDIFSLIRILNRELGCRLIVTGSYLGALIFRKRVRISAGDLYAVDMTTLTFREFCKALNVKYTQCDKCISAYQVYRQIGGYPAVVKEYIQTRSIDAAMRVISNLWDVYITESNKYLDNMLFSEIIQMSVTTMIQRFISEKTGDQRVYDKEMAKEIASRLLDKNISKKREYLSDAISWLDVCGIIGKCEMNTTGKMKDGTQRVRYYIRDLGLLNYLVDKLVMDRSNIEGYITENFVYNELRECKSNINAGIPWCSVVEGKKKEHFELDFVYLDKQTKRLVGLEVKTNRGTTTSLNYYKSNGWIQVAVKAGMLNKRISNDKSYIEYPIYLIGSLDINKIDGKYNR